MTSPVLVWFRSDLRVSDNPALVAAVKTGRPVACLYVLDEAGGRRPLGGASRWWLHHSLHALAERLAGMGTELHIRRGDPAAIVPAAIAETGAAQVFWNRRYGGRERLLDTDLKTRLKEAGIVVESFNAALLREPWEVKSQAGQPMKVFTPFWKAAQALGPFATPLPAPVRVTPFRWPSGSGLTIDGLGLLPVKPDWAGGLREGWVPGEDGAAGALAAFHHGGLSGYADNRDRPDRVSTSRLSPYLAFGDISPRQIIHATRLALDSGGARGSERDYAKFLSEVGWREFAHHLLFHNPDLATRNYQPKFDAFGWRDDPAGLAAWQKGRTGYPIVDAGMRELWHTGWMHNRVRMITASFLIKHLLIDWRAGERWFWDTLVDADPANNAASWQWVAGSGADAAPYYRIFNPMLQGTKFDPVGAYVRRWVPEIAGLPDEHIHAPWDAPPAVRQRAGIRLGETYPRPVVDHDAARKRALAALKDISPEMVAGHDG